MNRQYSDGSAGDADYGRIGTGYRNYRQSEPAFEAAIAQALGEAETEHPGSRQTAAWVSSRSRSMRSRPHSPSAPSAALRLRPCSVSEYSTRGGTSA